MVFKKITAIILALAMSCCFFSGCSKEEAPAAEEYSGVLTKIRLGMPMNKVIALNSGHDLYYETDTQIWCVNEDTDLMELRARIPEEDQFYYVEDSLITYDFKYDESDETYYLTGYLEEIPCLVDRETAEKYYADKIEMLKAKYSAAEAKSTITGTEDVDLNLDYKTVMTLSSFEVTLMMQLTYDSVDAVEGYYGTYYSISVKELANKEAVEVSVES